MNNQKILFEFIKNMSGQANILTIPREYITVMGSIEGGLLLSQIIYWSDKGRSPDGWFYKKYDEWETEICLSKYKVRKEVAKMVSAGFLETKTKKDPHGTPVVHYKFDIEKFVEWFIEKTTNRKHQNSSVDNNSHSENNVHENTPQSKNFNFQLSKNLTVESEKFLHSSYTEITAETTNKQPPGGGDTISFHDLENLSMGKQTANGNGYHVPDIPQTPNDVDAFIWLQAGRTQDKYAEVELEFIRVGWEIRDDELRRAAYIFWDIFGDHWRGLPTTKKERKIWLAAFREHVQRFGLNELKPLYREAIETAVRENLTISSPHSFTKMMTAIYNRRKPGKRHRTPEELWAYYKSQGITDEIAMDMIKTKFGQGVQITA